MDTDARSPWADIVGPCYTAASFARELGWDSKQVSEGAALLTILELVTDDDVRVYPAFQLWEGRVVDGLSSVLSILSTGTAGRWTWARWLNAPVDHETGKPAPSAIEQLRAGQLDNVLLDARHTAATWRI